MNEKKDWIDTIRKIPDWIKGIIGLIIALAGFVITYRNDHYLYSTLLGFVIFTSLFCALTYVAFARSPSPFGGKGAFKYDRFRRLAIVGNFGLIAIAALILNTNIAKTYLRYSIEGPPSDSVIYISRIIKDPNSGFPDATKFAVWLSASGDYYVDSIRVVPECTPYTSATNTGAQPPDAEYVFTYTSCSNELHALNPALYLDSKDQREVYFTLAVVPEGVFGGYEGYPHVTIYYHTPDGRKGSLIIDEPPEEMVKVSQLLNTHVLIDRSLLSPHGFTDSLEHDLLLSPNGLQRGFEENLEISGNLIEYKPIELYTIFDYSEFSWQMKDPTGFPPSSEDQLIGYFLNATSLPTNVGDINLGSRDELNKMLIEQHKVSEIVSSLPTGLPAYFDICAGLANRECKQALINNTIPLEYFWERARALAIMHIIHPDDDLANFVLDNSDAFSKRYLHIVFAELGTLPPWDFDDVTGRIIFALTLHPVGSWFDALVKIAPLEPLDDRPCKALNLLKTNMDEKQLELVKLTCDE